MPKPDLNQILEMLDEENVSKVIDGPHALARERYQLQKITVKDWDEFKKEIGRYYAYQMNVTTQGWKADWYAEGIATKIVNQTFAKIGGATGACQMAQKGINGGLRAVINSIYDWIVNEQTDLYFEKILDNCINPTAWPDQVELMRQLSLKFGTPGKPVKSPTELASQYKEYVKFIMERLQILRSKISR